MAIIDTHKAYTALAAGGFTEAQAQTLIETLSESGNSLATKADIADMATKADLQTLRADMQTLELALRADMQALEQATKADMQALAQATKADLRELELRVDARFDTVDARFNSVDAQFESLEQRMMIRLGAMLIAAVALIVTIQGVLLALFLSA